MLRRYSLLAVAAVGGIVLSSCSSVESTAATVNGTRIPMDRLESIIKDYKLVGVANAAADGATADTPSTTPAGEATATGNVARGMLSVEIRRNLYTDALAAANRPVTADDLTQAETAISQSQDFASYTPRIKELAIGVTAAQMAFQTLPGPTAAQFQALYEQGAEASNVACVSHILVATEAEAQTVLGRLSAGESFADLAAEVSTDAGSGRQGGVLSGELGACFTARGLAGQFVPEFVAGAMGASVDEPTAPVKSEFGYHIILLRPWADVADDALAAAKGAMEEQLFNTAKINVDPSIGTWSTSDFQVLPLGLSTAAVNG